MFTTSAIACVTLDADGKGEFNWQMSLQSEDGEGYLTPRSIRITEAPAAATLQLQSAPAVRRLRRTLWRLMKSHDVRMLRKPERRLLLEDMFAVPVHHAGAKTCSRRQAAISAPAPA